jgi:hypothetical protein
MKHLSFMSICRSLLMVLAVMAFMPHAALALASRDALDMAGAKPLSDREMSNARGGFIDPTGMILRFAVDVKTQIDGAMTFVRSIVMAPDASGHLAASSTSQMQAQNLPAGTTASIIDNGRGVTVTDSKGNTTALNQTASGVLASIITNTADFRQVTQTMNIDLVLQNVHSITSQINGGGAGAINSLGLGARLHNVGIGH